MNMPLTCPANQISALSHLRRRFDQMGWVCSIVLITTFVTFSTGCGREKIATSTAGSGEATESAVDASEPETAAEAAAVIAPQSYEVTAEQLLSVRLPAEEASEGWIRLFDGHTLFGWEIAGKANWRVEEGAIVVDQGEACLLCTSLPWQDFELTLEFNAAAGTNSGIFLRTPMQPEDPAIDCYEVNIAPADNPFPTASVVKRKKSSGIDAETDEQTWREMRMRLEGNELEVAVDGTVACQYSDPIGLGPGSIGLQHNQGRVAFRNIRLRPLGLKSLLDSDLSQWTRYPEMAAKFEVNEQGWLHVQGGPGQLETQDSFGDFALLAEYKLPQAELNSGIFFRCIPGDKMNGYECQLSNEMKDGSPMQPADCGTGGIFRRQDARIVAAEADQWGTVVLVAHGAKMGAWVNGLQVSDWRDDREPDPNPRRGLRLEPGTIMIQGHDPGTELFLKKFEITSIESLSAAPTP